ncbi:polyphosphate kinase 1 [Rhodohalobacter mucosus]|uniref:Polyphosphate kinase n=1 Tax=Rhodohalobacter mucosus TaxID=2079485 RepID=A0A316TY70_9BACT|nr:polyphosphate kinase 1 [Rhodohalobacter mucosus]PWN07762.1 polyphosphate kinase 1 [Rhodohalobacter mucosus]
MADPSFSPDNLPFDPVTKVDQSKGKHSANLKKNEILSKKGLDIDPSPSELTIFGSDTFLNYELSWLKFNWRVLAEAENKNSPLLERVKFIGIVCSNLDEFFQKRVGGLKRQFHAGVTELSIDGLTPREQLSEIRKDVKKMIASYRNCYFDDLIPALANEGIVIRKYKDLNKSLKEKADDYFDKQLYPIITPLAVDEAHPFPFISNKSRSLAIRLKNPSTGEKLFARIKIPSNRPRWIEIERKSDKLSLLSISDLIIQKIGRFFHGMEVESAHIFRVTRNADLERNEEEADDLLEMIEEELRERRFAEIVRVEIDKNTPDDVKQFLYKELNVSKHDVYEMKGPLGLADATQLYDIADFPNLKYTSWTPTLHPAFRHEIDQELPGVFDVIRKGDFIVHHPYHSFESSTQRFVEEAASDPNVLAIKQTLYRTSSNSPGMHALIKAAEAGKQVAVLVELKARFDEERNISWAQRLEKAGVHVSYGIAGLKIHTKLTIVVREEDDGLRRYVHIGTGNYHPDTAQLYEDLGYFTCREDIASDITDIFNLLTGYAPMQEYSKMLVAPRYMRSRLTRLIDDEIKAAKKGKDARIIAKMNNLEDPLIIQKLYEASAAGVEIDLIVRSVCRLIPGKKKLSERIRVHAVIGRFLEHSRCYYFHNNGNDIYLIGSADWMHRNLDARVEALSPIESPALKAYLQFVLNLILRDNQQRWILKSSGNYERVKKKKGEPEISTHAALMKHARQNDEPVPMSGPVPPVNS